MQQYTLVNLASPSGLIYTGEGHIAPYQAEMVQPPNMWSAYLYEHANSVTVNTVTYLVEPNDVLIFAPGSRVAHARIGDVAHYHFITFDMPAKSGLRGAMPTYIQDIRPIKAHWLAASQRIFESNTPIIAFAWNLMCGFAASLSVLRSNLTVYEAEAWILRELSRKFSVREVAEAVNVSQRHLLRAFRQEHGVSVNEYIQRKRVQEASRLLVDSDMPVKQVAGKVGFDDLQHFNKMMRMHTGVSPRAFREAAAKCR